MNWPLLQRIKSDGGKESSHLLDLFLDYVSERKISLYPAQEEAILELFSGKNIILNTPTGSGKSLVATALHFESLAQGRVSYYTSPIKALVNEKFLALCRDFGPEQVGMITGDASVNAQAPIICCTAEILSNLALRQGEHAQVQDVVMDEFHYYSDRDRGVAWQVPLLVLSKARFLLMSATLGDTEFFEKELTRLTGKETLTVRANERPVPLDFQYVETPLHETVARLIQGGRAPVYVVNFSQRECAEEAQNFLSTDFCTKEEKKAIAAELEGFKFSSPYGKEVQRILRHGIGLHHGGLLPKYRVLVERLAQKGLLKIISGTDTLGVGVNVPIRTVLFTKLCKYDGQKTMLLSVRDFHQISGRAGRKGFDESGTVVAQAPEHVVENLKNELKAAGDPKKLKKLVKRKPPEKGFIPWNKETFLKLVNGKSEALVSRFQVSHAMLLSVLARDSHDGCKAMQRLIHDSHEAPSTRKHLGKTAFQLFRSLVDRKIIEFVPPSPERVSKLRINVDLQQDFSLNQTLSLYLMDTIKLLDPSDPDYVLDLLSLVESILENPELVLRKQLDRIKGEKVAEMKFAGIEYDERMEELEKLEYPKPNRDFIYDTFNDFSAAHPWVGQENIRPKSVAREMYEMFQSFSEYIRDYDLHRVEGLLLRYLSDVYKVLVQTVPDYAKNDEIYGVEEYLGTLIRQVDSSLVEEWEKLRNPSWLPLETTGPESAIEIPDITRNKKAFTVLVRNEVFRLIRTLARQDYEAAVLLVEASQPDHEAPRWTMDRFETELKPYYLEHQRIRTDPYARAPKHMQIAEPGNKDSWKILQILTDPDEHNDWLVELTVDFKASREQSRPMYRLERIGPVV